MKIAIYGQYYQNSTEPIIKDIFVFFNKRNIEIVIESNFLALIQEKKNHRKGIQNFLFAYRTGFQF